MPSVIAKPVGVQAPLTVPYCYAPGWMDSYLEKVLSTRPGNRIAYFRLDGDPLYSYGTTRAVWTGGAGKPVNGRNGYATKFDSGYIDIKNVVAGLTNTLSVSLWVRRPVLQPGVSGYSFLLYKTVPNANALGIGIGGGNITQWALFIDGVSYPNLPGLNLSIDYHHLAATIGDGKATFYFDGVESFRRAYTGTPNLAPTLAFGAVGDAFAGSFTNEVSDVGIWNVALTPQEIWRLGPAALNYQGER